jgi:SOS-response transcriptional repressor LexA
MIVTPNYKDCIGFKVVGDSMIEDSILENDVIIVNPKIQPKDNNMVVVNLNGLLLVKRIKIVGDKWELHSSKKGVDPITQYDQDNFIYLGKVIEIRKFII